MSGDANAGHLFDAETRVWVARAACAGMDVDLFFPERGASTRGGCSERERRRIRKARGGSNPGPRPAHLTVVEGAA